MGVKWCLIVLIFLVRSSIPPSLTRPLALGLPHGLWGPRGWHPALTHLHVSGAWHGTGLGKCWGMLDGGPSERGRAVVVEGSEVRQGEPCRGLGHL